MPSNPTSPGWTGWQPPSLPSWDPTQGDITRQQGLYPTELIHKPQGRPASPADAPQVLQAQGWWQCPNKDFRGTGQPCGFWLDPQAKTQIEHGSGYFTCPRCKQSYNIMEELPWHGPADAEDAFGQEFRSGGGTRIGIPLTDQGQIGENLVAQMGTIPGYGPITWWHQGGARAQSSLDGAVGDWGIEVKTIGYDAIHHRFAPGGEGQTAQQYKSEKDQAAQEMGLKGVLGILVLLDYRRDVADIYVKEMPLTPWATSKGQFTQGVAQFRKNTAQKLVAEVPFESPYKDPNNPAPQEYRAEDYYQKPQPIMPEHLQETEPASEPMPF